MQWFRWDQLLALFRGMEPLAGLLWLGLAVLTVSLVVLSRTRWGQAHPLRKCVVLSLLAHVLMGGYATTVHIVGSAPVQPREPAIRVVITEAEFGQERQARNAAPHNAPWESFVHESASQPPLADLARMETASIQPRNSQPQSETVGLSANPSFRGIDLVQVAPPAPEAIPPRTDPTRATTATSSTRAPEPIEAPRAERRRRTADEVPRQPEVSRQPNAEVSPSKTLNNPDAGLPSALLKKGHLAVPRLAQLDANPTPERSLAGITDSLSAGSRGTPAPWPAPPPPEADSGQDTELPHDAGPSQAQTPDFRPPAMAMRPGSNLFGAEITDSDRRGSKRIGPPVLPRARRQGAQEPVPKIYRLRVAPNRAELAQLHGATLETEEAVEAALAWLAANQSPDGHWDANTHGAGREQFVAGHDRQRAGVNADTGIAGLALLAFLAAGNTHEDGPYQVNVRRGLEYLVGVQARDGNLGGQASTYAFMYCHAMATFALSEAYGMTHDEKLREPVGRAINYTLEAQDPVGGGWRYNRLDPGDTSQLGWQILALKSAEIAGIPIPESSRQGALRYLESISSGQHGGLGSYRPSEGITRPMTAEALVCRQFLGVPADTPSAREAGNYLLGELPGIGRPNLYYWYYGTLAMYQLQGDYWDRWNHALRKTLLGRQIKSGPMVGSWDPDTVWGGYGGRVYSTSLATLSLEVYYRFLPLYLRARLGSGVLR